MDIDNITKTILTAVRNGLFRRMPIFTGYASVKAEDLDTLEQKNGCALPGSLRHWLLVAGYGDINGELSFREDWFCIIEKGQLKGNICFSQNICGDHYVFSRITGEIFYLCRSAPAFTRISSDFSHFLEEFILHKYEIQNWMDKLNVEPYDWV